MLRVAGETLTNDGRVVDLVDEWLMSTYLSAFVGYENLDIRNGLQSSELLNYRSGQHCRKLSIDTIATEPPVCILDGIGFLLNLAQGMLLYDAYSALITISQGTAES